MHCCCHRSPAERDWHVQVVVDEAENWEVFAGAVASELRVRAKACIPRTLVHPWQSSASTWERKHGMNMESELFRDSVEVHYLRIHCEQPQYLPSVPVFSRGLLLSVRLCLQLAWLIVSSSLTALPAGL